MTVFGFEEDDPQNSLARLPSLDVERLPFGAVELRADGKVAAYNDTEPDGAGGNRPIIVGRDFFTEVLPWAAPTGMVDEFHKGVGRGDLNVVFDYAVPRISYRVRVHLKVSPILGTFWVFIKKLRRASQSDGAAH